MKDNGHASLGALVALKVVCCGGLLLATGAISVGSLLALVNHPAAKAGALVVIALGAWWGFGKWRARPATGQAATNMAGSDGMRP